MGGTCCWSGGAGCVAGELEALEYPSVTEVPICNLHVNEHSGQTLSAVSITDGYSSTSGLSSSVLEYPSVMSNSAD